MNVFAFDIETVPDTEGGRRIYDADDLPDDDVARLMWHQRRQRTGNEFLPHHLQRIVAISVGLRRGDQFRIWSLGEVGCSEAELIRRFFDGIDRFSPTIVSWNGNGFDLPVLHYRALRHGIAAPRYWEVGETDTSFRYNNYLSRFHWRHVDLMDVLGGYQGRGGVPLDEAALLCGLPGKMGMAGDKVWDSYLAGDLDGIRNYCETDVLNTYLLFLRFQWIRGHLDAADYARECELVRETLQRDGRTHVLEFLAAWPPNSVDQTDTKDSV